MAGFPLKSLFPNKKKPTFVQMGIISYVNNSGDIYIYIEEKNIKKCICKYKNDIYKF